MGKDRAGCGRRWFMALILQNNLQEVTLLDEGRSHVKAATEDLLSLSSTVPFDPLFGLREAP
jgi:hypothetical protein